jgi:hypothetical protein
MNSVIKPEGKRLGLTHILREHIGDYQTQYRLLPQQRKIIYNLLNCRTAYLGGHIDRCEKCGTMRIVYHSCRNRHCPTCQHMPRERWLEKRKQEILKTAYFHVVFTLPHALNTIVLNNKRVMLTILFRAASQTLLTFGENELGGKLGFIAMLHTWDQKLMPTSICIAWWPAERSAPMVPAGGPVKTTICLMHGPCHWSFAASSWPI